ncbi:MAG: serine/threonine protein kinase [Chitinispirillaceae bacterium]|nr:serine/threonine protein kinase [Chitinispirillaceae bacterium]
MEELFSETVTLSSLEPFSELPNPEEPKTIGSGIVTSMLGKGGAAVIYEIWNPKLEIHRAVKLWRPTQAEKAIQRFETEIKITAKLHHPNIVEIHAVGEWNNLPFIEIEKIEGCSIKELLKKHDEVLPVPVAAAIGIFICRALTYAHNHEYSLGDKKYKGVVHCDIKPANIMISNTGIVKLTDFGIALPSHTPGTNDKNKVTGSLQYMAPEQLSSGEIDVRTDIFSLGVVLYELFSGAKAFPAYSFEELIEKRRNHELASIRQCTPRLPSKVAALIEKCIKIDPDDRIQSVQEIMAELESIYANYSSEAPNVLLARFLEGDTISSKPLGNRKITFLISALIAVIITGSILLFLIRQGGGTSEAIATGLRSIISPPVASPDTQKFKPVDSIQTKSFYNTSMKQSSNGQMNDSNKSVIRTNRIKSGPKKNGAQTNAIPVARRKTGKSTELVPKNLSMKTVGKKSAEPVSDNDILDELWKLVRSSEYKNAERMFVEFPVNDAEFFLAYSEFQLKKGNFEQAWANAEKAMQRQAKRIDPGEVRARGFYLKAKALSENFNKNTDSTIGKQAMEAWFDVKYQYRSNTGSTYYLDADREIRRISTELQK